MRDRWAVACFGLGLVSFCVAGLFSGHHLGAVGALLGLSAAVAIAALTVHVVRHRRLVRALRAASVPNRIADTPVRLGDLGDAAFVVGLSRPTIYCDHRLPTRLTPVQLRAVLLHERAHQRALDPARLLLVELIKPVLRRLSWGRQWLAGLVARREIAADRAALSQGASCEDLASALLALPPLARAHVAGFTPAVDLRLRALLGDEPEVRAPAGVRRGTMLVAGGVLGATACAWFLHRSLAGVGIVCC